MKFRYFTSWDEMVWHVRVDDYNFYKCAVPWHKRPWLRETLEAILTGEVYCWNGTCTPNPGQSNWGSMLTPDNELCYLAFTHKEDEAMFMLKYNTELVQQVFSSGSAAWFAIRQ